MCDEVLFNNYINIKTKMNFIAVVHNRLLSLIAQLSLSLRQTLISFSLRYKSPANIYWFHVNTRKSSEICSKLKIQIPEKHMFIIYFEHISHLFFSISIAAFAHVFVCWTFLKMRLMIALTFFISNRFISNFQGSTLFH